MKVLVLGSGGREHALIWKLRQSPLVNELYCAPGNPGIEELADLVPIAVEEVHELADFAADLGIDLTVVGPELPLTLGIVNEFERRGLKIFGPRREAAEIEGSKTFAKEFMQRHDIPTGDFDVALDRDAAEASARRFGFPVVLKADGLAGGKGVLIVEDEKGLQGALKLFYEDRRFGRSAEKVVVEEFLVGEEVSFIALSDGQHVLPMATTKDYKRIGEDDTGPNTGGMGAHSPAGFVDREMAGFILDRIMRPTVSGLALENRHFRGVLYAGLILTDRGPRVLEFNARFGDPEAQALMLRLEDDLLPVLIAGANGSFGTARLRHRKEASACVVLASRGYPGRPEKGHEITGIEAASARPRVEVFHSGTARVEGRLVANGGRVLNVAATGRDLRQALRNAYEAAQYIEWEAKIFRRDIGRRVVSGDG